MPLLKALLTILLPPVAVAIHTAEFGTTFWLNLVLTLCGHIPGVIHAIYLLTTTKAAATGQRQCGMKSPGAPGNDEVLESRL